MKSVQLDGVFKEASCSVIASKRPNLKTGIRLMPYCEIFNQDPLFLEQVKIELLKLSVSSTVHKNFLRIQGIQNCSIMTGYIRERWWVDAIQLFLEGKHRTKKGIVEILQLRESRDGARDMKSKASLQEVIKILMEAG